MAAIETEDLSKDFLVGFWRPRPYRALDRLTLSVDEGEVFGFLGPNGAGKSTTLKLLMQLIYPTSGALASSAARWAISSVQAAHRLPAGESLLLRLPHGRGAAALLRAAVRSRAARTPRRASPRVLDDVGLGAERRLQLRKFSKGMIQRVGLAQALLNEPEVVFLDEPMSGLDPLGRRDVRALILRLRDRGCTVFFSSHILSDAESLCSRVAILAQGRLVASGRLSDILAFRAPWLGAGRGQPVGRDALRDLAPRVRSMTALAHGRYTIELPPEHAPDELLDELRRAGAQIVSLNPLRETLEDYFVQSRGRGRDRGRQACERAHDRGWSPERCSRSRCATGCRTTWWLFATLLIARVLPDQPADGRPGPQDHQGPRAGGDLVVRAAHRGVHRHRAGVEGSRAAQRVRRASKPISRGQFVLGKYFGLVMTLVAQPVGDDARPLCCAVLPDVTTVPLREGRVGGAGDGPAPALAVVLTFAELMIVTAIALFFSTFSSPLLSALLTFGLWVTGHFNADLRNFEAVLDSRRSRGWRAPLLRAAEPRPVQRPR